MTLIIPDDILKAANLDERTLSIELACHLFDKGRLNLHQAATLAGMGRTEFEDELHDRHIPIYRYDLSDLEVDLRTLSNKPVEK